MAGAWSSAGPELTLQLQLQHDVVKAGRDAYFAGTGAEGPIVSDFYLSGTLCKLLKIKGGLEQPLFTVGRVSLTEFRQSYAGALEKALFPSEERHAAAAGVLEAIAAGTLDGKPIAGRPIFKKFVALLRTQLTNELGDDPCVRPASSSSAADACRCLTRRRRWRRTRCSMSASSCARSSVGRSSARRSVMA